ncbi:tautomerase family protein [Mycolicibacter hiberniae]|uniref:Uncharacterized protein n=1 Tax=Mycolicibacter hiberniae TaxID=29314 RepID=A0A7I7X8J9_9MYCO|nr:tautomerase family protein [Mycolicibacter hiberniae]MCV7088374.1 tautomerase family protein [Mycolicibacter hiberniae]ORV68797.1 4-oxalocrotonate tautomerase [Mycolicibacter hiberniae]BBZ25233.1 hypothetical protein MHIB_36510 [Mycolicibacter hiberniae]
MPLWTIHHTPGLFSAEDKQTLAARITDQYVRAGLPRFYVVTLFHETAPEDFYVGGEPTAAGIRIVIDHIARRAADPQHRRRITEWINQILIPSLQIPDLHWEFHVDETSEEMWMINGLVPPPGGSEAEKRWARENAVSAY